MFIQITLYSLTLCEVIPCRETDGLQFTISHELDVQVPPTGADICRAFLPAVSTNEGRETKGPIADLDVVELALPGWLYGVLVIKEQVDALPGSGWRRRRGGEKVRKEGRRASERLKRDGRKPHLL